MTKHEEDRPPEERPSQRLRRPYRRPQLIEYGPLAKLTRGALSGAGETHPGGKMTMG